MTKREYLESIGYKEDGDESKIYVKNQGDYQYCQVINTEPLEEEAEYWIEIIPCAFFNYQKDIDDLQIAFNNVKRDFKEMQKYED